MTASFQLLAILENTRNLRLSFDFPLNGRALPGEILNFKLVIHDFTEPLNITLRADVTLASSSPNNSNLNNAP